MCKKKTLLVLGAARYQLEAILRAHQLGYRVVTADNVPNNPGHTFADRAYCIDTTNKDEILRVAISERISGVISPATDVAVPTAAFVADKLGLPGPPPSAVRITCDKAALSQFLTDHAFPGPPSLVLRKGEQTCFAALGPPPWIVKPDCSSGSKGCSVVSDAATIGCALADAWCWARNRVVIQKYIEGHQGTAEGVLSNGSIVAIFITDRQTATDPYVATIGHRLPSRLPSDMAERIAKLLQDVLSTLGITDGVFDCDFVVSGDGVFVLELSPRLGGNCIARLIRHASGFDILQYAIQFACRDAQPCSVAAPLRPTAVILLGTERPGRLDYNEAELCALRKEPWVLTAELDCARGTMVSAFTDGRRRVGEAFLVADDRDELDQRVSEFCRRLALAPVP